MNHVIPLATLAETRWRNGAGRKADIAAGDGWVVGFAWLDIAAPFSDYAGHDRTITLVDGPGFSLHFPTHDLVVHIARQPTSFDGGAPAQCRIEGPCMVLNAMTERRLHRHSVTIQPPGPIACNPDEITIAVSLDGPARFDAQRLQDGITTTATTAVIRITDGPTSRDTPAALG